MRVAVIDLGTNTFNLLIAELSQHSFKKIYGTRIAVKLGEGGINKGYIAEIPFQRGVNAMIEYKKVIDTYSINTISAFATSAIRSADNGQLFIESVKKNTGIHVDVISGDREAELIYFGNRMATKMSDAPSLIMDIGGGSTEFIIANKTKVFWKQSFLLGAARLLEKFNPENPISNDTIISLKKYLKQELQPLFNEVKKYQLQELIGSSGAFDSVVDLIGYAYNTETLSSGKTEYLISLDHFKEMEKKIVHSTTEERMLTKGLIAMRVDMIVISFLFVSLIIDEFQLTTLKCSTYSLKEGVIAELIEKYRS